MGSAGESEASLEMEFRLGQRREMFGAFDNFDEAFAARPDLIAGGWNVNPHPAGASEERRSLGGRKGAFAIDVEIDRHRVIRFGIAGVLPPASCHVPGQVD